MKVPTKRLDGFYGGGRHQGVVARVEVKSLSHSLDEILEQREGAAAAAGARRRAGSAQSRRLPARGRCRRLPRGDRAQGPCRRDRRAVIKVASGAADTPYIAVTNLARTLAS